MTITSLGDLALSSRLRRDTVEVKKSVSKAATELSSGVTSNVTQHLKGELSRLASFESDLLKLEGYRANINTSELVLSTQQSTLQKFREFGEISATFLTLPQDVAGTAFSGFGAEGLSIFEASLNSLNIQSAGTSVFSGTETRQAAVADSNTILGAIEAEISLAGLSTASDIENLVNGWFAPGGGFDTIGYTGGAQSTTNIQVTRSDVIAPAITAQASEIRDFLTAASLSALVGRENIVLNNDEQAALIRKSGERLLAADENLILLQSEVGRSQRKAQIASVEVSVQKDSLEIARANLIEIDPYEAATELQSSEARLTAIFTITGRLAQLSLTTFLR